MYGLINKEKSMKRMKNIAAVAFIVLLWISAIAWPYPNNSTSGPGYPYNNGGGSSATSSYAASSGTASALSGGTGTSTLWVNTPGTGATTTMNIPVSNQSFTVQSAMTNTC